MVKIGTLNFVMIAQAQMTPNLPFEVTPSETTEKINDTA